MKIAIPFLNEPHLRLKKTLFIIISTIIIIVLMVVLFISTITKYLVEKYDNKYTGRKITLGWTYVNPLTGYIHLSNLKIYEQKSDSIFFTSEGVSAKIAILKLFSKTFEISKITLNHPRGIIIQNKRDLNFNDLIKRFSSKGKSNTTKEPFRFNIISIKVIDGEFYYREKLTPINYFIKKVNFESKGKRWNSDTIAVQFSFLSGVRSGGMKGNFTINFKNLDYRLFVTADKFDLNILEQYLKDLTNYGSFSANIDAGLNVKGNFRNVENVTFSGMLAINDFHFGINTKEDYGSFDKFVLSINELSPKNHKYLFDSVSLSHPYFRYERYDYSDNMQRMFGSKGDNISTIKSPSAKFNLVLIIGNYIKDLSRNFFKSNYKLKRLAIYNGEFNFNDYSLTEKFAVDINPLFVFADSIDKNHKRVNVSFKSGIKPYGNVSVALSINPKDSSDFDLQYSLQKLPASMFNPYTISYTSFPLDRGTVEFNGTWNVRNGFIQSVNHLVLIDPRVTRRLRNKDISWLPLPLIMSFIRERGNVIDYEIPITGNLKNPKFHLHDILFNLFENIFVKPATSPYRMRVKNIETEIEKSLTLKWEMRHSSLLPNQEKFIGRMAEFLAKNPDVSIAVYPEQYATKEKEYILFFEAKKKYFLTINKKNASSFSEDDIEKVDNMSVKDSLFVHYLNKQIKGPMLFTIQEKCALLIDSAFINAKYEQLNKERVNAFMSYFKKREVEKRIKIYKSKNVIPYNGFSFFKIDYKGELPESLITAYREMNELNDEAPRKKFKEERKRNKNTL